MRINLFFAGVTAFVVFWCVADGRIVSRELPIQPTPSDRLIRIKRQSQTPDPTDQFFNNVFQIPISTLTAVNELIKSTRPVIRRARERIQQQYQTWQQQNNGNGNRVRPIGTARSSDSE